MMMIIIIMIMIMIMMMIMMTMIKMMMAVFKYQLNVPLTCLQPHWHVVIFSIAACSPRRVAERSIVITGITFAEVYALADVRDGG